MIVVDLNDWAKPIKWMNFCLVIIFDHFSWIEIIYLVEIRAAGNWWAIAEIRSTLALALALTTILIINYLHRSEFFKIILGRIEISVGTIE